MAQEFYPYDNINPVTFDTLREVSQDLFHSDVPGENAGVILERLRDDASRISVRFEETQGIQTVRPVEGSYIETPLPAGEDYSRVARGTIRNLHRAFPLGMVELEGGLPSTFKVYDAYVNIGDPETTLTRAGNLADYMTNAEGKEGLLGLSRAHAEGFITLAAVSGAITDSEAQRLAATDEMDPDAYVTQADLEKKILEAGGDWRTLYKITGELQVADNAQILRPDVGAVGMPEGGVQFAGRLTLGKPLDYLNFESVSRQSLSALADAPVMANRPHAAEFLRNTFGE